MGMARYIFNSMILVLTLSVFVFHDLSVHAEEAESKRPRVGLVLSGGGARGLAHVGVIKILEQYGIHVDYVVGTSMGGLVGGLYAGGYDAAALEKTALAIEWENYFDDRISRSELSFDEKKDESRFIAAFPFYRGEAPVISGIIEGVKLHAFLNRLLFNVQTIKDFNSLPIPFACIATDIYTGEDVILNKGHLPTALRATMSIPSIFTPVELDGHLLVDGGLVLNFPVSVARAMGADIIIGVDVGTPLYKKGEVLTIPKIIDQMSSFKGAESTRVQRGFCDILITPNLDGFNSTDFNRTAEFITAGEKGALIHSAELQSLSNRLKQFNIPRRQAVPPPEPREKIYINEFRSEGLHKVSRQLLENRLQLEIPASLTIDEIEKAVSRAYGSRFFKSVTYRIDRDDGRNILFIKVEETSTDFLKVGIRYDSDLKSSILINTEFKNILGEGSRFDIEARLGENPAFNSKYKSGTAWPVGFGFGAEAWYESFDVFSYLNGSKSGEYKFTNFGISSFLYMLVYHNLEAGLGIRKEFVRINDVISMQGNTENTTDYLNPYLFLRLDTIDRSSFPRSGITLDAEVMQISDTLPVNESRGVMAQRYFFNTGIYIPVHPRLTLLITDFIGIIQGDDVPADYYFCIGGMNNIRNMVFPFIGLNYMEVMGTNIHAVGAGLQFEILKNIFITARGNVARVKDSTRDVSPTWTSAAWAYCVVSAWPAWSSSWPPDSVEISSRASFRGKTWSCCRATRPCASRSRAIGSANCTRQTLRRSSAI